MFKKFLTILTCVVVLSSSVTVYASDTYTSELSGKQIDVSLKEQRPIAIMVDNEQKALPHYGVSEADVVYEIMNSTANGRITRLMCFYKDWASIDRIGSVRSVRTTNIPIAAEYNAVLIHEGGPELYITKPLENVWIDDLNGGFSRLKNGKATEFTEFVLKGEVQSHAANAGVSLNYNEYRPDRESHFVFSNTPVELEGQSAVHVDLSAAFAHTASKLEYNPESATYDYYVYGTLQADEEDGERLTFDNVILQIAPFYELDSNGYLTYQIFGYGSGYYLSRGKYKKVNWKKTSVRGITKFFDAETGEEIQLNIGKTYVGLIPAEYADGFIIS